VRRGLVERGPYDPRVSSGPAAGKLRTSVLVLNFNGRQHLDDCFASLAGLEGAGDPGGRAGGSTAGRDEVCLVDNGSTDGSVEHVRRRFPWVRVIDLGTNLGYAGGYDAAVPLVDAEWVALLNGDTRVRPGWLRELHLTAARHPACRAVASRVVSWDGTRSDFAGADTFFTGHAWQRGLGEPVAGRTFSEGELLFGCGASLLLDRRTFLDLGGFDPGYFAFFEDVDLGWRMAMAGHETWLSPDAVTHHKLHGYFGSRPDARVRFFCERNALANVFKNFGGERAGVLFLAASALAVLRGWSSSAPSQPDTRPYLTTDALAHVLAVADVSRLDAALRERRGAAQAARRRGDDAIQHLFGDLASPPTALGPEYREPLRAVVGTLGLASGGFGRDFGPDLNAAAWAAARDLGAVCAGVVRGRFEAAPFFARGYDLDWEHALDAPAADRLRGAVEAVGTLLGSDFGPGAVASFSRSLAPLHGGGGGGAAAGAAPEVLAPSDPPEPGEDHPHPAGPADAPLVTIVVRTRNRPLLLAEALASVAAQRYRSFEVVVVDDGEEDAAPVIAGFGDTLGPVRIVRSGGAGRSRAAQAGLEAANGEFVNFLDDDDELLPDHLESLVATQRRTGARVVHSDVVQVARQDDGRGSRSQVEAGVLGGPLDPSRLLFESTLPMMSVLMDRELALAAGGFDPSLGYFEDWDLFLRLSRIATFAHAPGVTARYRIAPGEGHGSGMAGAHRWPFLAAHFERHRDRISGTDWARFYRAQVESVRRHARELAARAAALEARAAALEGEAAALGERAAGAERAREHLEAVLRSVESSRVFRLTQRVRRFLGRR
jgi:GT2 family glycosyltransferase